MIYEVKIKPNALEELNKLPKEVKKRIVKKIVMIRETPQSFMKKLKGEDIWSLRVGDYRILIDIFENEKLIEVVKVGHRKNVYK